MFKKLLLIASLLIVVPAQAQTVEDLYTVQFKVNSSIKYTPEKFNKDNWAIPKISGDCEDFVLLKRKLLIENYGFLESDLKVLLLYKPSKQKSVYEGHVVLYIEPFDMILDNSTDTSMKFPPLPTKYSDYFERNNYKLKCVVRDLSLGDSKRPVTDRC